MGHDNVFGNQQGDPLVVGYWIQIMQMIWIIEGRQLSMFLLSVEDLYVKSQLSSLLLHYLPLKLNTWQ